jgi:hypothetical protein
VAVFTIYSSILRRCQLLRASPAGAMYQPRKRTLQPGAHVGRSLSSTRLEGTGAEDMVVEGAEGGGNYDRGRGARAKVSASDIIPSCIHARFMASKAAFNYFNTVPPTLHRLANLPFSTLPRAISASPIQYVQAAHHPAAPPSHSLIGTRSAYPSRRKQCAISPELIENHRVTSK